MTGTRVGDTGKGVTDKDLRGTKYAETWMDTWTIFRTLG